MRKLKITGQLVVVFSIIVISSLLLFTLLSYNRIQENSKTMTMNNLYSFVDMTEEQWKNGKEVNVSLPENLYYVSGQVVLEENPSEPNMKRPHVIYISQSHNLGDIVLDRENIARSINLKPNTYGTSETTIDGTEIYMSYGASEEANNSFYFILFLTDQAGTATVATNLSLQIILVFTISMGIAIIVLITWSHRLVNRIRHLQKHITEMKNNNYDISYSDKGNDEVTELVKSVEDMRIEIRENDKTKQEMLQNISHDFKTPIGVIKSYAEAMQDGHMLDKGPDVILKQSEILYNKTEQLITYNKLEYLTKDKEFESVNIRRIIESVEAQFKASRNDICFENNLEDVYFLGYADNYRIVIENIIDNALRYAKKIIKISLKEDRIEIYNDGEHIDSKFITDGFKAYEKGSNGKFGLGMSIVVKTLSFFGYRLIVKNEDVGVSFIICR